MANIRTGRRSGLVLRGGRNRRETAWLDTVFTNTTLGVSGTAVLINSLNAAALALRPFTVVRVRGQMLVVTDQAAASENFVGNLGKAVVSDQAVAIGVTALPTPGTDRSSDLWFVYESIIGEFRFDSNVGTREEFSRPYDSKAMRKVEDGQDLVTVVEAGIGGSGLIISHVGRTLIKLH